MDLALIDGPHAYPFPDLEYYRLYPHLDTGALLVIDDIHIPTIHNLYEFLRRDAMFEHLATVRTTAFFRRTAVPTFDPRGDDWQLQGCNRRTLLRYDWRDRIRGALPSLRLRTRRNTTGRFVSIDRPQPGALVGESESVSGSVKLTDGQHLWILARRADVRGWWPQAGGHLDLASGGQWHAVVRFGETSDAGHDFEIVAAVVTEAIDKRWANWVRSAQQTGAWPPVQLPPSPDLIDSSVQTVRREQ